jgi:hypothetical protein
MSYIVGGGDHYKLHTFVTVSWDRLNERVRQMEQGDLNQENEEVHVSVDSEGVRTNDLVCDYQHRPSQIPFSDFSFWEYAATRRENFCHN